MKKIRLVLAGLALVGAVGAIAPSSADIKSPGQCKKHTSGCNGNNECAPNAIHLFSYPNGQQKKC